MLAVTNHETMLIAAVILFFVCAFIYAIMEKSITGTLLCVGLALFAWSFILTT